MQFIKLRLQHSDIVCSALSKNCSDFRTTQLRLCFKHRGESTPSRYSTSCIGWQSSSRSHTSWQFWRTKFGARPLRFIYTAKSQNMPAAELYVHLSSRCWTNHSWEQTSPGILSSFQHHLPATRCHKQFSSVILCRFLNPDLKLFSSIRLLLKRRLIRPATSVSLVTTTCHYRNSIIIISTISIIKNVVDSIAA